MNIKDFKDSLDYLVKAELTPFIWGHAGIGKSSIVKQFAESKGYHFFPFYLGTMSDNGDILGLAEFQKNEGTTSTVFAMPEWLSKAIAYCNDNPDSGAIIFLDEFNRAPRQLMSGMFSFCLDKTFHTIKLPKNCHIIAAGNPPTDEYFTTDIDETALMARFVHVKLEPTVQEWIDYAKEKGIQSTLIDFIRNQPELLEQKRSDFSLPVKADRRSYERLNRLFTLNTPSNLLEQLMHGIIGLERTVAYLQFLKEQDRPLSGVEVLTDQKTNLIEKWSNPEDIVASYLNLTCDNLKEELRNREAANSELTVDEKKNLMKFLTAIPKDISYPLIKDLATTKKLYVFTNFYTDPLYERLVLELAQSAKGKK